MTKSFINIKNYNPLSQKRTLSFLTKFKKIIIPNSSFSWWGAWLNKNNPYIIAPKYWFNYNDNNGIYNPPNIKTNKFIYL